MQQGGSPSPFDRNMGTKLAAKCAEWMHEQILDNTKSDGSIYTNVPSTVCLLGVIGRQCKFSSLQDLAEETDFE